MAKPRPRGSNNLAGGPTLAQQARRDQIEEALAVLYTSLIDMDELSVRIDQAIRRTPLVAPVLEPARQRLAKMRARLSALRDEMAAYWRAGQSRRWE